MRISDWSSDVCSSDLVVSINAGFPWADIHEAGPSVTVTHDGRPDRAAKIADSLMDYVWETRHEKNIEHFSPDEAMAICREAKAGDKPIVQIGRASCRERVCQTESISVGADALKKKNKPPNTKTRT